MNTQSAVANTLRISLAAPHMLAALQLVLPLVKQESEDLLLASSFTAEPSEASDLAMKWLEAAMHIELAIKKACPPEPLPVPNLLTMPKQGGTQ